MSRLTIAVACTVLALALGACGSDNDNDNGDDAAAVTTAPEATTTESDEAAAGDTVRVSMKDIKFIPEEVTVKVGQQISWSNDEAIPHNVTATDGADFASETMNEGDTYEFTPTAAGTIAYTCTIHPGQDGTITVTE
ncbi:MAG: cupredoxin domain-containing protein [Solirubrobacteraceae bacterium]|nr:cupredoxin domain-containing protein [Solirubrobacteraceae bacterium]